jgi:tRNA threonylcarbamoyladenosine biosynthesis protein TsaE
MSAANFEVPSIEDMHELGRKLGNQFKAGDLILISGPLGAGKTALTQGIGKSLGIEEVTSPTFVISRIHEGNVRLVHVDAYRLQGQSAALFDDLDLESYLPTSVTVVEWGEGLADRFSSEYLEIKISYGDAENDRNVALLPHGARWQGFKV